MIKKLTAAAMCLLLAGCSGGDDKEAKKAVSAVMAEKASVTVRIKAVGDNLIHSPIYKRCATENGYDFTCLYENVAPYLKNADIAAINQETIFVSDAAAFSGYPEFGTPSEVGDYAAAAGFNVVTHATNHVLDKRVDAIENTLNFWKKYPHVSVLGIHESREDSERITVFGKQNFKIAMLNYTYGLNGHVLPKDCSYMVDVYDEEKVEKDLGRAEREADFTVVFIHFGTEYTHTPTKQQLKDAEFLCENGADLIIGAHPHVIQGVDEITAENGNSAVVFYSLGNFISNQDSISKVLCGMADVTLTKKNGKVTVDNYEMLPLVTHAGEKYTAYMLSDYTDELAAAHRRVRGLTVKKLQALFNEVYTSLKK